MYCWPGRKHLIHGRPVDYLRDFMSHIQTTFHTLAASITTSVFKIEMGKCQIVSTLNFVITAIKAVQLPFLNQPQGQSYYLSILLEEVHWLNLFRSSIKFGCRDLQVYWNAFSNHAHKFGWSIPSDASDSFKSGFIREKHVNDSWFKQKIVSLEGSRPILRSLKSCPQLKALLMSLKKRK